MSLARAVSASQASDYYYEQDPILAPEGKAESSFWFGSLAEKMDLQGRVDDANFSAAISGLDPRDPDSKQKLIQNGVNNEHRAGVDLAYSAPKSVSIIALHVGDKRLLEAQTESVQVSLDYYERNYSYARKTINNKTTPDFTGNIMAACFTHSVSRSVDPQLHTHSVIINMTETDRGLRAIDNYQLFNQQNILLSVYQSELAKRVQELGYNIEVGKNGNWEIAGVDKDVIEAFSKRSKEIEEAAKLLKQQHPEWSEAKIRDVATLKSRDSKDTKITEHELKEEWQKTADREQIKKSVEKASLEQSENVKLDPRKVLQEASKAIHENESTFKKEDVLNTALRLSRGQLLISELENEMNLMLRSKEFQIVGEKTRSGYIHDLISTKEQIQIEKSVLDMAAEGKNTVSPILPLEEIAGMLKEKGLTVGQESMVANMLGSQDRFTIVQGDAGTGKTFAVDSFNKIVQSVNSNISIHLMGFTGRAAFELEHATGVSASTIDGFLLSLQKQEQEKTPERSVWIVDEASMVSSKHFYEIMKNAKDRNASVHFVGDGKQLQAVGAGRLFKDLQALNVVKTVEMGEVLRQRTAYMKYLVENIKEYQEGRSSDGIINAFEVMADQEKLIEAPGSGDRINKAVELYMSHYTEGESVIMITPINKKRHELNQAIREELKKYGDIEQKGKVFSTKQVVNLSGTNRRLAGNYEEGMRLFLSSKFAGIKAGSEGIIKNVDTKNNSISVSFNGKDIKIDLGKHGEKISAFKVEEREFVEGDKIVFGKNDKKFNVQNGAVGIIKEIKDNDFIVKVEDGSERKFDPEKQYSFIDHGYVLTVHKSQGQTANISILITDAGTRTKDDRNKQEEALENKRDGKETETKITRVKSRFQALTLENPEAMSSVNTSEMLYVAATRAKDDFFLITDSAEDLLQQTSKEQAKTSTIDIDKIKREEIREQIKKSFNELEFYKSKNNENETTKNKEEIKEELEKLKKQFGDKATENKDNNATLDELQRKVALARNEERLGTGSHEDSKDISQKIEEQKQLLHELFGGEKHDEKKEAKEELFKYEEQEKHEELERT